MPGSAGARSPAQSAPNPLYVLVRAGGAEKITLHGAHAKVEEDKGAEERAGGYISPKSGSGSRDPCSSHRRESRALRWVQRSHHQHRMQTRRSSPAVSPWGLQTPFSWLYFIRRLQVAQPRLLLGRKAMSLCLTSPSHACWLPNGRRGGLCPGKLAKFAYGEGENPQLSRNT